MLKARRNQHAKQQLTPIFPAETCENLTFWRKIKGSVTGFTKHSISSVCLSINRLNSWVSATLYNRAARVANHHPWQGMAKQHSRGLEGTAKACGISRELEGIALKKLADAKVCIDLLC